MWELIGHLWPEFELLTTPGIQTKEIGVWLWLFMVVVMIVSVSAVFYHRIRCWRRLAKISRLIDGQDKNTLASNRIETLRIAEEQDPDDTGKLWREFDESLVYSSDKNLLSNTLDAEHFFNSNTLAYGLTANRMLAAAPSFLTAIGVLGTFIGLTLGLKDLQVDAGEIETLKSGVSTMINGAAVAFMTSVWGIGFSLVLNMFEKFVERRALKSIRKLQQRIDYLYPRLPAEHSLVQIAAATDESKEALQELHERIGDRLQETVSGMSDSMQQAFTDALNKVMAPAVQALVDNASQQSTQMIEKLVTNFMEGIRSAGSEQGQLMKGAASEVQSAVSNMGTQMETLFKRLDEQQTRARDFTEMTSREFAKMLEQHSVEASERHREMGEKFSALMTQLDSKVAAQFEKADEAEKRRAVAQDHVYKRMITGFQEQQSLLGQTFGTALEGMKEAFEQQSQAVGKREAELEERFGAQMERLASEQHNLLAAVSEGVTSTQQQMSSMAEQHRELLTELSAVTRSVEASSQHMSNSSTQLGVLSSNLKQAADVLDERLKAVTESLEGAAGQNRELAVQVGQQADSLRQLQEQLDDAIAQFSRAAETAENGFRQLGQHQQAFLKGVNSEFERLGESLKRQVEGIEKQAEQWLRSYSSEVQAQVTNRMDVWNETTLKFADEMRRTVSAISGIVDDLEQAI